MKYKVNDRVKVRKDLKEDELYEGCRVNSDMEGLAGKVVTISKVYESLNRYGIKDDKYKWRWSESMFEDLIPFTKADLKDGDKCTLRNGVERILSNGDLWGYDLNDYNEVLTSEDGDKFYDIIKVERPVTYETVFEREKEPKEMTLKEVCEKLGYEVKIIKED